MPFIQAARVYNGSVKPWELAGCFYSEGEVPIYWTNWAIMWERVDAAARSHFIKEQQARARHGG